MSFGDLRECLFAAWSPTIGDPTPLGWITVVAYLAASCLSVFALYRYSGRQRVFWLALSVVLLLLAVNKQLDLQSALTAGGRCLAQAQGWYEDRRAVQVKFILAIIAISAVVAVWLVWVMRREIAHIWLALIGVVSLLSFIAIRAAGFHHFDQFIGVEIAGVRMNGILELGGISMIAANAIYLLWSKQRAGQ
jgi:hypothetical protein